MQRLVLAGVLVTLAACNRSPQHGVVRLVDSFDKAKVEGNPTKKAPPPVALWNFSTPPKDASDPLLGWKAGDGVTGLKVVDGKLTGKATTDFPILYVNRPKTVDANDALDSAQVRIRVSAGANVSVNATRGKPDWARIVRDGRQSPWTIQSPLSQEKEFQTLTLPVTRVARMNWENFMLRPTTVAGATFEIESVQAIPQRERRAAIRSGVGWQGLADIFRETLVSRSPEKFQIDVDVPPNAWLDLNLGTLEDHPVTFKLAIANGSNEQLLLQRTITTPHRWEPSPVDLSAHSGKKTLRFWLDVPEERMIGFWGSPAIRTRGAAVAEAKATALGKIAPPQGVVLIMCDTLRKDHLPMYGHKRDTAPNLAKIASQGALFLDNVAQATWTKVSTPSILTSLYPTSHGVHDVPDRLPASAETLAESYRSAGFATISFSSVPFTGKLTNLQQGFEELHESSSVDDPKYRAKSARVYVDRAAAWIEQHKETPFFMFLHVFDPHSPFEPRAPYDVLWADPAKKEEHDKQREKARKLMPDQGRNLPFQEDLEKAGVNLAEYMQYDKDWYDGSIRGMDAEIGRFVERLRRLDLEGKVQIVILADHGEEFIEHGKNFHGQSAYGELAGVPLLMYRPGVIPAGVQIKETVRNLDVMPTLLELSGLPAPKKMQGQSLLPLIAAVQKSGTGSPVEAAKAMGWKPQPAITEKLKRPTAWHADEDTESFGMVWDGWKLLHHVLRAKDAPEYELFDHRTDPLNLKDVAAQHPEVVERLKGQLAEWRKMAEAGKLPKGDTGEGVSAKELERLKSLGYVQ
jgi:arylsulfatase A-like enzyme